MRIVREFPLASGVDRGLGLVLEEQPPEFKDVPTQQLIDRSRAYYTEHAERFVDALLEHAPGGFVDAVLGELLYRKSTIFRVTGGFPEPSHLKAPLRAAPELPAGFMEDMSREQQLEWLCGYADWWKDVRGALAIEKAAGR